jgi:hypothetical protein
MIQTQTTHAVFLGQEAHDLLQLDRYASRPSTSGCNVLPCSSHSRRRKAYSTGVVRFFESCVFSEYWHVLWWVYAMWRKGKCLLSQWVAALTDCLCRYSRICDMRFYGRIRRWRFQTKAMWWNHMVMFLSEPISRGLRNLWCAFAMTTFMAKEMRWKASKATTIYTIYGNIYTTFDLGAHHTGQPDWQAARAC